MIIDAFIVKLINTEPFYDPKKDLILGNIQDAWDHVLDISKENNVEPSNYYIIRILFPYKEDIIRSIQFSADGVKNYIKNYKILNTICINNNN